MKRGGFTSGKRGGSVSGQRGSTSEIAGLVLLVVLVSTTVTFMVLVSHRLSDLSDWHIGRLAGPRSQASADTPLATPAAADTPAAAPPAADSLAKYSGSAKYLLEHEEPECAELIRQSSKIMFVMLGGRGYHDVRARTGLRSWARCVCHVMVLTDPSVDIAEYISPHRILTRSRSRGLALALPIPSPNPKQVHLAAPLRPHRLGRRVAQAAVPADDAHGRDRQG